MTPLLQLAEKVEASMMQRLSYHYAPSTVTKVEDRRAAAEYAVILLALRALSTQEDQQG